MSAAVSSSPANQNRPLLLSSPLPSDRRVVGSARRMRTLLDLLTFEKMDGLDHRSIIQSDGGGGGGQVTSKWRILKERLGLNVISCCGVATWRVGSPPQFPQDEDDVVLDVNPRQQSGSSENNTEEENERARQQQQQQSESEIMSHTNLAEALAAEREYRETGEETPSRVSLMRLLEETEEGGDLERERMGEEGSDQVCCVCMGRNKGAALIPCGHTYCRVCSREVWLHRGSCPLCNQPILEILDIF